MDSTKTTYATFPFEWSIKSTSYQIQYRKAFNIDEIDEVFCSIINAKGNEISFLELGILLGFNLQDLAEKDILNIYLKSLTEYNLIAVNQEIIRLTEFGQDALQSKLKFKYYFATTELFENQTAIGENFDFSFKSVFDIENKLSHEREIKKSAFGNPELKKKLQFQLFGNDIYEGDIVELYESSPYISYKSIGLQCEVIKHENLFHLIFLKLGANKPDVHFLIDLPGNAELKSKLLRKGMFHHILAENNSITKKEIETYIDLWNWKELAENPMLNWSDKSIFKFFLENGDGSIWSIISERAPIESIKSVIEEYSDYWNWTILSERFDDNFIKEQIENFNWDFEELSYKENELVTSLLTNSKIKDLDWDWNYLSKSLPDNFIEKHIEDFPWDFYVITESKKDVFKNTFINYRDKLEKLISKNWNWKFISEEINLNFLHKNISGLASELNWHTVLNRFFNNEEISAKCLKDESFKTLLKKHLPENFIVAHQKYLWTSELIDFFENQNLIQWESQKYINGFDTNVNVEWSKSIFQKYRNRIITESGFLNVSRQISDYGLIEEFADFAWNWDGLSQNEILINNASFVERAFIGNLTFTNNLNWQSILSQSTFDVQFWNKYLEAFYNATDSEKHIEFWNLLTQKEKPEFLFANKQFPWDWSFITENSSPEVIFDSYEDEVLFEKWDWEIATPKFDKEIIFENLEDFAQYINWKYLINEVFTVENELAMDKQLPRIAACLTVLNDEKRKDIWKDITVKFTFETLLTLVESTHQFDLFEWDWDYISNHKHFPTDIATLNKYKNKINWTTFSHSRAIQQKFNPESWDNNKLWFSNIDRYLQQFEDYWNWQILSLDRHINYNRLLLQKYKTESWDWDYLSEFGGFLTEQKRDKNNERYLEDVLKQFPKIKYEILSKRKDIKIDNSLILSNKDKSWDWSVLSENEKVEISIELILELQDRNWNWKALSKRKKIEFINETLIQLIDKDWDWNYISENENLVFNADFIEKTKTKSWNWNSVSRHKSFSPIIEILKITKDFDLDWKYISKNPGLNPTKELLAKFENKWHWQSITENPQINFDDIDFIERFVDKWDWRFICESGRLTLNTQILNKFKQHLEWNLISSNTNIQFTQEIIQEFKQFWNWSRLKENKRVEELLGGYVLDEINKNKALLFIDKIEQQWSEWKGSIYHFSHIDNAVEIIKNRKIQSRNKANILGDAAGNVVHRRGDAHDYARFYFRPHTPTQFYNEFLGKNTTDGYSSKNYGWVSWYDKARGLGFPKCPIPIFFRFSLKEVLFKYDNLCCISNGNMQTSSTKFGTIDKMIDKFGFDDLYYTPQQYATKEDYNRYRNYAQQEFLVKDELCFDALFDFEIVCPSEADRTLLINLLGNEHKEVFSIIVVDRSYYNNNNPRVRIEEEDSELHISTNFNGEGYFVLNVASDIKEIEILVGDVTKTTKDKIIFKSNISVGNVKQNIQLNFVDESNRNWFVYANNKISANQNIVHSVWDALSIDWKVILYLNWKVSLNRENALYSLIEDVFAFHNYDTIDIRENVIPHLGLKDIELIMNLKQIHISELNEVSRINDLSPLSQLKYLEVVRLIEVFPDLSSLYRLDLKLFFLGSGEFPYSAMNIGKVPISREQQDRITKELKRNIPSCNTNPNRNDFFKYYYGELGILLDGGGYSKDTDFDGVISYLSNLDKQIEIAYNSKVRHYLLKTHTIIVCKNFYKYFFYRSLSVDSYFFYFFLFVHDIGKPSAFLSEKKDNQYYFSSEIIKGIWDKLPFTDNELNIIISLLSGDYIGEYFQNKLPIRETKQTIFELAKRCEMNVLDFFKLFMIYYQCDIASYTVDAGGIKFLEHLFEYRNGEKVFNEEEGLLKMTPKYWEMYKQLKNEIEHGN